MQTVIIRFPAMAENEKATRPARRIARHRKITARFILSKIFEKYKSKFFGMLAFLSFFALYVVVCSSEACLISNTQFLGAGLICVGLLLFFTYLAGGFDFDNLSDSDIGEPIGSAERVEEK